VTDRSIVSTLLVLSLGVPAIAQQSMSADEKQIRELIAAEDKGKAPPRTADRIFWSGAYKRPTVGNQSGDPIPDEDQPANRVEGSQRTRTTIRRIEVAKSGDLAYEFNDAELSYDLKNGKHISFPRSALRVWKKEGGQWKVAAHFSRQHTQ
jgi:hypothetical protein